ncbi:TonB-dependent receptor [Galbibacter orientalis]|uniref:TonB-dependent receptor n=1 Tax=Galbibacter orientalis TaxID=453852 RepID=UPI00307FD81D
MTISKILSLGLCFALCSTVFAQNSYSVKGSVLNANTLNPIEGATIIGEGFYAISSSTGQFIIKNLSQGTHTLYISHVGFKTKEFTLHVKENMQTPVVALSIATTNLDEIEVHGKSKNRKLQETPTVSYEIDEEFLKQNRENSLMQTLDKLPGVSTINIGSGQSKPVIRGLGFNRVSVVQNGIKHEAQQWGSDHGLEIDQYGIEAIQIIKGPASLLYGSDAIAGVVNIKPAAVPIKNSFKGDVNLLGESNNDLFGISAGIQKRNNKWFYNGRITYRDYGDYKVPTDKINYENYIFELHKNNLRNTAGKEANASFSLGFITDHLKTVTYISNVNAKNGFFANAHGLEVRTSNIDYDSSNRDIDLPFHTVNHFKLTNNTTVFKGNHQLNFDVGFQNNYREEHSEPVPHGYMPKPTDSKERLFNKNTFTINARDQFKLGEKHEIVAGLNGEFQDNSIGGWGFLIPAYHRYTAGLFAYDQFEINSDLHLQAGIRYDYGVLNTQSYFDWYPSTINNSDGSTSYVYLQRAQDKTLNFGNFSGSLGLSYINNNTSYKINLGKSFRMPLANELASDGVNYHMYRYEKGNLDLDAEESYQLDLEITHTQNKFSVGISPFFNFFDNYIYLNPTSNYYETLQIYEYTQSKVFRMGGEIQASTKLFKNLQLDAALEYVYSRQTSGSKKDFTLPFSPPLSGLFTASYQFKKILFFSKPQIVANYRITADQNEIVPPEEPTNGYQVLNMSLLTEINVLKNKLPLDVRIKLNNVFNKKYFNHTSFYRLIEVPEAGRNIAISLTQTFN